MSDGWVHDLVASIKQHANDLVQEMELNLIGHVIEYDVTTHMCRVLLQTRRAQDHGGGGGGLGGGGQGGVGVQTMETGWCQVGSLMVGDHFGIQYALKGGATAEHPERGEQVQLSIQHRPSGLAAVANLTFNDTMPPPGGGNNNGGGGGGGNNIDPTTDTDGSQQLQPGELIIKHESGSFIKFYQTGDVRLYTAQNLYALVQQDCDVTVLEGDMNVDIQQGDLNVTVEQGNTTVDIQHGHLTATVQEDCDLTVVEGDLNVNVQTGDINMTTAHDFVVNAANDIRLIAGNTIDITATSQDVNINAGNNVDVTAADNIYLNAGDDVDINATDDINLSAGRNIDLTAGVDINLTAVGNVTISDNF